jgi:RNase P/RNase MRP subunit p29
MLMKDLLEQLMQLNEAPVKPGERKGISFKLKKLEKISDKLRQYQNSMSHMKMAELPGELQKEMQQLQDKLNTEIEKVDKAYQVEFENSKVNGRPVKMDNLFKALAKNCKEIIKVYKELNRNDFSRGKFLFRGIRSSDDALYGKPFDARKPKDSNRDLHELVNGTINSLGFTANRENSMFVTGDRSQASGYGNSLYIMFPVDGFTFTWSQTVKDLVLDSSKRREMLNQDAVQQIRFLTADAKKNSEDTSLFPSYPEDLFYDGYKYDSDVSAVSKLIKDGLLPKEAQKFLDSILTDDSIQDHFKFTDQNLFDAILSEKEIYIRGDYYAVNVSHSTELFKFLEEMDTDNVELPESFGEVPNILDKGDVVRILNGTHEGKLGTITYTYSDKYEVFISQKAGDITISKDEVELYHLPDGSIPVYERDDKIIVTDPQSRLYGVVADLYAVYSNGKVEFDAKGNYHSLYKSQVEKYTPEREQEIQKDLESRPPVISIDDEVIVSDPDSEYYGEQGIVNFVYSSGNIEVRLTKKNDYIDFQPTQLVLAKNAPPELLKTQPETENQSELQIGDTVQVINDESSYYGEIGEVIEVSQSASGNPSVRLKNASYPSGIKTFVGWVKKVDQPKQTFKAGDVVKIKEKSYKVDGSTATVIKGPDSDGDYKVITDDGKILFTAAFQMEKIEGAEKTFKAGDAVKVIGGGDANTGKVGEIQKGPDGDGDFTVIFGDGDWGYYQPYQLEKASATPASSDSSTFNIGDKVKIIDSTSEYYGEIGKIQKEPDSDGELTVVFDDDDWFFFVPAQIEKIEQAKSNVKFTEGETVKLTGSSLYDNSSYIGHTGTITSVSDDGKFVGVRINGDDEDTILTYSVTNLSKTEGDVIDNLKWEPEPEVTSPAAAKFEVNDRVEVVGQFPSLIGETGTVVQVSPNYDFVSVQIDNNTSPSSFPSIALKKINEPQQPEEFHLGDMVEVVNDSLASYGQKGKVTDMDVTMLVVQDSTTGDVFFAKKSNVKKIG